MAINSMKNQATESLPGTEASHLLPKEQSRPNQTSWKPIYTVLLCGFLVSLSFGVTQVPCAIPKVEAGTAQAVALLGSSTTLFGIVNLFVAGYTIKKYGVRSALVIQVSWPAFRLAVQALGISTGGNAGIIIVQASQIITIIGGPTGYLLALNTYVSDLAENKSRTGYLGRLQGCTMFGSAVGFLVGGQLAQINILLPFQVALVLFVACTIFVRLALPWIAPDIVDEALASNSTNMSRVFGPLKTIYPAKWMDAHGHIGRQFGPLILATGVFLATLATGYIPTLLQLFATGTFGFDARENSYLVSSHLFLRGLFLTLLFPKILSLGRRFVEKDRNSPHSSTLHAERPQVMTVEDGVGRETRNEPPADVVAAVEEPATHYFDLVYTRLSLFTDGTITLGASCVQHGWQMYMISALLPFGAGTSSAAKGTILQMCPTKDRTDALAAISLLEMMGRLSTTLVFGLIYSAFANIGKTYLVFVCNAVVALFGFIILLFAKFPPQGSIRLDTVRDQPAAESPGDEI